MYLAIKVSEAFLRMIDIYAYNKCDNAESNELRQQTCGLYPSLKNAVIYVLCTESRFVYPFVANNYPFSWNYQIM